MINQNLEQINLTRQRSLLMIKTRWFLAGLLLVYTTVTTFSYPSIYSTSELFFKFGGLFIVIFVLISFNLYLHWSYKALDYLWRHKVNNFVTLQLAVDLICALAFIHFSGGVLSWFWTLLILYTIELTYFLPDLQSILAYGGISIFAYSVLVFSEYFNLIPKVKIFFLTNSKIQSSFSYVSIVWISVIVVNVLTATISFRFRTKEEPDLADRVNKDSQTKLYNRKRFMDYLNSEVFRAKRYGRVVSLMMFRIENFNGLIEKIGLKEGDKILGSIGIIFKDNLRRSDTEPSYDIDIACRYENDTFAVILPETDGKSAVIPARRMQTLIDEECAKLSLKEPVSLSISVASFPDNSTDSNTLIDAAMSALNLSKTTGQLESAKTIGFKKKEKA